MTADLVAQLRSLPTSGWGPLEFLRRAHEQIPDLPARLFAAIADGVLVVDDKPTSESSFPPFGLLDVYQWLDYDDHGRTLPPTSFEPGLDDRRAHVRNWSAALLGQHPAAAVAAARQRIGARKVADRVVVGQLLATAFREQSAPLCEVPALIDTVEALLEREKSKAARAALSDALQVLKTHRPVPPSIAALPAKDDLEALASGVPKDSVARARIRAAVTYYDRDNPFVPFDELADALDLSEESARAHAAAVVLHPTGSKYGEIRHVWSSRGITGSDFTFQTDANRLDVGVDPWTVEKLALDGRTDALDTYLRPGPRFVHKFKRKLGDLRWRDGSRVSDNATEWYLAALFANTSLLPLISALLDDDSLVALAHQLLGDPKEHRKERFVLPPTERVVDEVVFAQAHRLSGRKLWQWPGLQWLSRTQRWLLRMFHGLSASGRQDIHRIAYDIERHWPTRASIEAENIGGEMHWRRWLAAFVELAMVEQRSIPIHALRGHYLAKDFAAANLQGVVFARNDGGYCWVDAAGRLADRDGPLALPGYATVRVAHPVTDLDPWPDPDVVGGPELFPQRSRPRFGPEELPAFEMLETVPNRVWKRRCAALGYFEMTESTGEYREATRRGRRGWIEIRHSGYGSGYGGAVPVTFERLDHSGVIPSEAVWDVRRLFGLDPLPEALPRPLPIERPTVLAKCWPKTLRR